MIKTLMMQDIPEIPKETKESHDYWDGTISYESTPGSAWWFHEMSESCNRLVSETLGIPTKVLEDSDKLIRISNDGLPPHDDGGESKISCIVYLEVPEIGGELIFTKQRRSVKPEKNLLVFFPNTEEYTHMVDVFVGSRLVFITYLIY
jgi:hypothetical protein